MRRMRIGVISDTHLPRKNTIILPKQVEEDLKKSDLILHAGDFKTMEVVEYIGSLAPFEGVAGNVDSQDVLQRLGKRKMIECAGFRIGLVHGDGIRKTTKERAKEAFKDEKVDVIIFGHSHIPHMEIDDGILLINPGSPTDKRQNPQYSYATLELGNEIKPQIHYFL